MTTTPAQLLTAAADWLSADPNRWGREDFVSFDGCRCALGAIAYVVDSTDEDGDPFHLSKQLDAEDRLIAKEASAYLADYLVNNLHAPRGVNTIGTVGDWNDRQTSPQPVIDAMRAAAQVVTA